MFYILAKHKFIFYFIKLYYILLICLIVNLHYTIVYERSLELNGIRLLASSSVSQFIFCLCCLITSSTLSMSIFSVSTPSSEE